VERETARRGSQAMGPAKRSVDLPLVAYGLVVGILAVGANTLVSRAAQPLGVFARDVSFMVVVAMAVAASLTADSILGWLRDPRGRSRDHKS
jgi:hypothetical protein